MAPKIALCFRGLHTEFPRSWDNINNYIINDLRKTFDVDIFLNTYKTPLIDDILLKLNPVAVLYNPGRENIRGHLSMTTIIPLQIIELCDLIKTYEINNNINYDYIIITRFDLIFNNEFSKYDINYDKINLECMFVPDYNSGDNFILFKRQYLDLVNKSTKKCMECNDNSHQLYKYFNESGDICHYIGGTTTKRNPHYDVMFRFTRYV